MTPVRALALLVVALLAVAGDARIPGAARAQQGGFSPSFQIAGAVARPLTLDLAGLISRPQTSLLRQCFYTDTLQPETHVYTGVPLWSLLTEAGLAPSSGHPDASLRGWIVVTGSDGYQVVIALAEIDPALEGRPVLVAHAADGEPLGPDRGMARLIVAGDRTCMRSVWWLAGIEVRYLD